MRCRSRIALLAMLLAGMLLLGGCMSFGNIDPEELFGTDSEPEAEPTPLPPLTAELFTDYDSVYAYYNQVTFDDTLVTLTARFGDPVVETDDNGNNSYTWVFEDGYGVTCAFYSNAALRAKVVHYEDMRQFKDLSDSSGLDSVVNFDSSITFQTCVSLFRGRPIEVAQISEDESTSSVARVYCWLDKQEQIVQIFFKSDGSVESISYQLND